MKKILLVTNSLEPNVSVVEPMIRKIASSDEKIIRLDTDKILDDWSLISTSLAFDWMLRKKDSNIVICSQDIGSIWYRRPSAPNPNNNVNKCYHEFTQNETQKTLWGMWTCLDKDTFWMNHPETHAKLEFNKAYQMKIASNLGMKIPETCISNDPDEIYSFFKKWNDSMIIKASGGKSVFNENNQRLMLYTSIVSEEELKKYLEDIKLSPVMAQEYVHKKIELRITIVGGKIFTCAIYSQDSHRTKIDWRHYDFKNVRHEIYQLPEQVEKQLLELMKSLSLNFGAIDMILTPEGEYVFLEVNPSGQWGWIENLTGMPISKSIAELLVFAASE